MTTPYAPSSGRSSPCGRQRQYSASSSHRSSCQRQCSAPFSEQPSWQRHCSITSGRSSSAGRRRPVPPRSSAHEQHHDPAEEGPSRAQETQRAEMLAKRLARSEASELTALAAADRFRHDFLLERRMRAEQDALVQRCRSALSEARDANREADRLHEALGADDAASRAYHAEVRSRELERRLQESEGLRSERERELRAALEDAAQLRQQLAAEAEARRLAETRAARSAELASRAADTSAQLRREVQLVRTLLASSERERLTSTHLREARVASY
eukprot:TRINITY_DN26370_c0_g1_i1.p1 TRINITY_DN26370_c0_g1~~TRINITY_DN26370_c0_g1_i1.p1  ORF type:complete len:273 (+),score=64.04 TRINITY_DN26370_c0_g1_i1:162-980(+)